jgi:hypothetical protein
LWLFGELGLLESDKPGRFVEDDPAKFVERMTGNLLESPHLQSIGATATHCKPTVWLLDQELRARGTWKEACAPTCPNGPNCTPCLAGADAVYNTAAETDTTGRCFSGGGMRSATFNLGVLKTFAGLSLLGASLGASLLTRRMTDAKV